MRLHAAGFLFLAACTGLTAKDAPTSSSVDNAGDDDVVVGDDDDTSGDDDDTLTGDDDDTLTGDDDDTTGDDDDTTGAQDSDGDGVLDADDQCEGSDDSLDADADTIPDGCDPCPSDPNNDTDGDGVCDLDDACPLDANDDTDKDGLCDSDDPCPTDVENDADGDGLCGALDPCPSDNPNDTDGDGVCDSDDPCPLDRFDDSDADGLCDSDDPCRFDNPDDTDGDTVCDSLDPCPLDALDDSDGDGACDSDDLCPGIDDDLCDIDGDGYGPQDGDCCETTDECGEPARVNPSAVEAPTPIGGIAVDDDCDGLVDEVDLPCDVGLLLDDTDPASAVSAIGLCDPSQVVSSNYVRANGTTVAPGLSAGLMTSFGTNVLPREGSSLLVLSSGRARTPGQAGSCGSLTCGSFGTGTAPPGFPQTAPGCVQGTRIYDDLGLDLTLTAPSNAVGYSFSFNFYTFEYPEWVCSQYNDQYITLVTPPPLGAINGNISFDAFTNPVSVNIAYFDVCSGCALGTSELVGTGFDVWDDAGATGWLQTTAPITPGDTFSIRFAIWDTGDNELDSTVLIDNFQWILEGSPGVETLPDN
jgi:hypothetical protein